MAAYEFPIYDTTNKIVWELCLEFWQDFKIYNPDESPFTDLFWDSFDIWAQVKYKVINKPYKEQVFAFKNKEDQIEFLLMHG